MARLSPDRLTPASKETLGYKKPTRITFVLPMLNEAKNLPGLAQTINKQQLDPDVEIRYVISDNGSDSTTKAAERALALHNTPVYFTDASSPRSISSALRVGMNEAMERFHEDHPDASSHDHVIIRTDADTRIPATQLLQQIVEIFSDPQIMVGYGPTATITSKGKVYDAPLFLGNLIRGYLSRRYLRVIFARNERNVKDFLNPPRDLFPGFFTVMREEAYSQFSTGYHEKDVTGDDARLSAELQRRLLPENIAYNNNLKIYFNVRQVENADGEVIPMKALKDLWNLWRYGEHMPHQLESSKNEKHHGEEDNTRNRSYKAVIGDFIQGVEHDLYHLADNEKVQRVRRMTRRGVRRRQQQGMDVRHARNATTGKIIPRRYVVIEKIS